MPEKQPDTNAKVYLVGGGIASLAAAAFLIRDGNFFGHNITILEESEKIGGSLNATGNPVDGYVVRGGRLLEDKYVCTYDLFSSIPTLDRSKTVTKEIFELNKVMKTSSKSRLIRAGQRINAPKFGLSEKHILSIERLGIEPEAILGRRSISDQFDSSFFDTDFWCMWSTTFGFQSWHSAIEFKRYLRRFVHLVSGFNTLSGIMRTPYNEFDSMIRPLQKWLEDHGVKTEFGASVTDLHLCHDIEGFTVEQIVYERSGRRDEIRLSNRDYVIVTLGSMTEGSSLGSMESTPITTGKRDRGSWALWEKIAEGYPQFGHPATFSGHIDESKWVSFTTTLHNASFFNRLTDITGNTPGESGLITFPESNWLVSIALPHQPYFIGQPTDVNVFWGYGLFVDKPGNFVKKPMSACTGREIMAEILGHLRIETEDSQILKTCTCIPRMMPFITSQFLRRAKGDRPHVLPERSKNLAFIGQFCELPDDVVFTMEYSVRSAQTAVYSLLGLSRVPSPVYKGHYDPRVLLRAFLAFHDKNR